MEKDFDDDQEFQLDVSLDLANKNQYLNGNIYNFTEQSRYNLEPPRQIPKRSYSLQADMVNGWKPRLNLKINLNNVFPINFSESLIDNAIRQLVKQKSKQNKYNIIYLGPRPSNSYNLHESKNYSNPYPIDKKIDYKSPERPYLQTSFKAHESNLKFDSNFEGGNLDIVIEGQNKQYDLFMRVDSNTKGHTNWFYFEVKNQDFIGSVRFNICNFRRQKSLYQRGLKPYGKSIRQGHEWKQIGKNVKYQRKKINYIQSQDSSESEQSFRQKFIVMKQRLSNYFVMSFTYDFELPNDIVSFAYCIPYTYSQLKKFIGGLKNIKQTQLCKSLSGLSIPLIEITESDIPSENKKCVLVTSRIHPGESNSSYVVQGFLEFICNDDAIAIQLRKMYHIYVIPMINPDGVIAGNYRTSLFGKDLNRTFNQHRKYAFPETYYLMELVSQLKKIHKQRFCIYLDLHGHSVKKNVFMYGPDYSISHNNYNYSRQLPKILGSLTPLFRYYSCVFKISSEKVSTARAILNRNFNIPYTYTMQSSNGTYYDPSSQQQLSFTAKKWKQMGMYLCQALWHLKLSLSHRKNLQDIKKAPQLNISFEAQEHTKISDDEISQGKSDSEPQSEDLGQQQLNKLQQLFEKQKKEGNINNLKIISPQKRGSISGCQHKHDYQELKRQNSKLSNFNFSKEKEKDKQQTLPPIITQNKVSFMTHRSKKRKMLVQERLKNLSVVDFNNDQQCQLQTRVSISQMVTDLKSEVLSNQQVNLLLKRKIGRQDLIKKLIFNQ